MKLYAVPLAMSVLMLCGSVAMADCTSMTQSTTTTTTSSDLPVYGAGSSATTTVVTSDSAYADHGYLVNRTVKNCANQSGNGSELAPTIGVDYGIGRNFSGPVGGTAVSIGSPCGVVDLGAMRTKTVGFPPHHRRWMIYDNNVSTALPLIR